MTRSDEQRLDDIRVACEAVSDYLGRGSVSDDIVFDAIRIRLVEVGEAVEDLSLTTLDLEREVPWGISHECAIYSRTATSTPHAIVEHTARHDIPHLHRAVLRLQLQLGGRS